LIISHRLFRLFSDLSEGELTIRRSRLVQTSTLAEKSLAIGLDKQLRMSRGEEESGGRHNPNLLANSFEAVLGSLFLDSGLTACTSFLQDIFPDSEILSVKQLLKDPKSLLQEKLQASGLGTPVYTTISSSGPDHAKNFVVQATVNHTILSQGSGPSKQKAETAAAVNALAKDLPTC
jgi:ribonuclease-3